MNRCSKCKLAYIGSYCPVCLIPEDDYATIPDKTNEVPDEKDSRGEFDDD